MKKIIIIGSGVAGLTAGICGQKNGFETIIYEKNPWVGGSCSAWKRNGFVIDNCLHWLTGTRDGSPDKKMWEELGVLKPGEQLIQRPYFLACEAEGATVTLWRDISKTRKEMLEISPADKDEINAFLNCVQFFADLMNSGLSARELYRSIKDFNSSLNTNKFDFTKHFVKYLNINSEEMADRFVHPAIQALFTEFMAKEYESYWLMLAYSFYISGNGDLPPEGSLGMARNLKEKYLELGGKIVTNCPAKQIIIDKASKSIRTMEEELFKWKNPKTVINHHAIGVLFENGKVEAADYIIPACDIYYTYKHLLGNKYTPKNFSKLYSKSGVHKFVVYGSFQAAFAVDGLFEEVGDTLSIGCGLIQVGTQYLERFSVKNYRCYGEYIAPENKTVIQVSIPQYEKDYKYWLKLSQNQELYKASKNKTAMEIMHEIEVRFPDYKGKLSILDVWTPYSYKRLNNDYLGAYMRYITTPFSFNAFMSSDVRGLDNVVLASHWLRYPGGLPTAAYTGRDAIESIKKIENYVAPIDFLKKQVRVTSVKTKRKMKRAKAAAKKAAIKTARKAKKAAEKTLSKIKK